MNATCRILIAGAGLLWLAIPVMAHHGFDTEYDAKKKVNLTGVVTKVEWTNPHMHIYDGAHDLA